MDSVQAQRRAGPRWFARAVAGAVLSAALALTAVSAFAQQGAAKIGYVDMKRLLDNAPQLMAAQARLKAEFDIRDAELKADEARLAELQLKSKRAPDEETRAMLNRQADALSRAIDRTKLRLRDELEIRRNEEIDALWPILNDAVAEYGREHGYDLILASPVVYVSGRIDVTDDVLALLRQQAAETR